MVDPLCFDPASFEGEFKASNWLRKHQEQTELSEIQLDLNRHERTLRDELSGAMRVQQFPQFVQLARDISSTLDDLQQLGSRLGAWRGDSLEHIESVVVRLAAYDAPMQAREEIASRLKELQHLRRLAEGLGSAERLLPPTRQVCLLS